MKYLYRISLSFMILTILSALLLGVMYFFRHEDSKKEEYTPQIRETVTESNITDCDTEYVILELNVNTGESVSLVEAIPSKYIGKTKEELISILEEEERSPTLRERQKGLQTVRLSAFSDKRVVIVKTYGVLAEDVITTSLTDSALSIGGETVSGQEGADLARGEQDGLINTGSYYLMAMDGMIWVYHEDMKTVYLTTGILLDSLPDEVRQEILDKKYIKNEEELYNFLESYSS
ncbi:MAG: hypothetical protein J1E61_01860 [Lachnospiraceae bacterium]|nr:hypothetical protein [Lachnospiraceae bacterium]